VTTDAGREANEALTSLSERVLRERWRAHPTEAAYSGLHEFDGVMPDLSQAAFDARVEELRSELIEAEAIDAVGLDTQGRFDHTLIVGGLRGEIFELTRMRSHLKDPMALMYPLDVTNYMDRSYAPVEQRIADMARLLHGVSAYLDSLRSLLVPPLAPPVLEQAIEAYDGIRGFYDGDLAAFVDAQASGDLARDATDARKEAAEAVGAMVDFLKGLWAGASASFAIGADLYAEMLHHGEMVDLPLGDIEAAGERELARNQAIVREAAERIAPGALLADAVAVVTRDHPSAERLIDETREMLEEIRTFVVDHDVASVVSEVRCQVRETPAFMRWAFAAMDGPGAFEQVATESFYYVTPVEDHWTAEQAEEWLSNFNYATLKVISVHEVYPGHYVHFLRHHNAPSDAAKVFGAYSFWEGWAHYCEEMMLEAGYGEGDPRMQLAQAQEALVRVCRLLCSIRMHTQGLSLDGATRFFQANAYMEELPAQREATRGTFDPGYLNYTLGKLLIYKLRADWQAEQGDAYSLKAFHDELLSHGGPPVPLLRTIMLRYDDTHAI
jgi:uncharacterized protein (DUF885 family)